MNIKKIKEKIKKLWKWVWNSDSILSWIVALAVIFIIVKFVFFPLLSLIMGTSLPLAGVESSSMEHGMTKTCLEENLNGDFISKKYGLCGDCFSEKDSINFNEYWTICGQWYEERNITKQGFSNFPMKDGFSKGDIMIVWGRFEPKIGDIIIFTPEPFSKAKRPIIHRIVKIENGIIQTKGDHNKDSLTRLNNENLIDETKISQNQIIGKAIFRVPYLGWVKIGIVELPKKITNFLSR